MSKKNIIVATVIAALLFLNFVGKPYFRRKDAVKVVQTILTCWKNDDFAMAMSHWEEQKNSPPVYDLITYEIGEKIFEKQNNIHHAQISVVLYFPPNNLLPSEKKWIFKLNKTRYDWKVTDFYKNSSFKRPLSIKY